MKPICFILSISIMLFACKKNQMREGEGVEIYLLKSSKLIAGKCQVDATTAVLEDQPLISNEDILQYRKAEYEYTLTDASYQKVKSLTPRTRFAVTVDKKIIYYAIYMPSIMSSTCFDSITMDALGPDSKILFRLGYPWAGTTSSIDDQRNNAELIAVLKNQGKVR